MFGDEHRISITGHGGVIEVVNGRIYMGIGLRNAGSGLAVIHGWRARPYPQGAPHVRPETDEFRPQGRDLYIPVGERGFWQGAIRDPGDPSYAPLCDAADTGSRVMIDLLYGDHEGGQRTIARFGVTVDEEGAARSANVIRYWSIDYEDPRPRGD